MLVAPLLAAVLDSKCRARNLAAGGRAAGAGVHAASGALTVHSPARMTDA